MELLNLFTVLALCSCELCSFRISWRALISPLFMAWNIFALDTVEPLCKINISKSPYYCVFKLQLLAENLI